MNWHNFFIQMTDLVASKSKDRSTKVGAVIINGENNAVLSMGYNGFPRGVNDDDDARHERPAKYRFTEHAERNAIYNAARNGIKLEGTTLYLNWEPIPCTDCTRAIIQSGITRIIGPTRPFGGKGAQWTEDLKQAKKMLDEAGVELVYVEENNS